MMVGQAHRRHFVSLGLIVSIAVIVLSARTAQANALRSSPLGRIALTISGTMGLAMRAATCASAAITIALSRKQQPLAA